MAVYTFAYDPAYNLAMPVIEIRLIAPGSGQRSQPAQAVIDCVADSSMMPVDWLDEIRALSVGLAVMSGI